MPANETPLDSTWARRVGQRLGDFINPITVKEMRQAVGGRFIASVLLLFLLGQTVVVAGYALMENSSTYGNGPDLFMILLAILLGTCLLFVPANTAQRLVSERNEQNVDLMFITTLRPWRIISGKFASAMIATCLIFSLCMPFMTLAYLMRGIDMPTIFLLLGMNLLVVAWCILVAILLASLPMARFMRSIVQFGGFVLFAMVFMTSIQMAGNAIQGGLMMRGVGTEEWLSAIGFYVGSGAILFTLAVAAVSPASSNRALLPRVTFVVVWAVLGLLLAEVGFDGITAWGWLSTIALSAAMLIAVSERDQPNRRVLSKVPKSIILRVPAFLFYSGAAGGIYWTLLLMVTTLVVVYAATSSGDAVDRMQVVASYTAAYALAGFLIARFTPLSRVIVPAHTFVVGLVLMAVGAVVPLLVAVLAADMIVGRVDDNWWLTSIFVAFQRSSPGTAVAVGWLMTVVMLLAISPWSIRRMATFRPYRLTDDPAPADAITPVANSIVAAGETDGQVRMEAATPEEAERG